MEAYTSEQIHEALQTLVGWSIAQGKLTKTIECKHFLAALARLNQIAQLAENQAHHPDLHLLYTILRIEIQTHSVKGLTEKDFILAHAIDTLPNL